MMHARSWCSRAFQCQTRAAVLCTPKRHVASAALLSRVTDNNTANAWVIPSPHCHGRTSGLFATCKSARASCSSYSTATSCETSPSAVQQNEDHLSITVANQSFRVSYLWLRDHCRCTECFHHECRQNFVDVVALPSNIRPERVTLVDNDNLQLTWPDSHTSTYSLQWLRDRAPRRSGAENISQTQPLYWDKRMVLAESIDDVHVDELREGSGLRKVMENLHSFGFTFVSGIAPSRESTEEALGFISSPMRTFYGDVWEYQNDGALGDTATTALALKNHTDGTYFYHAPGGLVLHCISHDGSGGENTLVDGFFAARRLRETQPEHYDTLATMPVVAHYLDDDRHYRCCHTVLTHDIITGELQQIRFNPHDRSDLSYIPYEDAERFYSAYRALGRFLDSPDLELKLKLQPGRMVVFDNYRLLHGRASFTGKRMMVGCYFDHDDLQNLKRSAANIIL